VAFRGISALEILVGNKQRYEPRGQLERFFQGSTSPELEELQRDGEPAYMLRNSAKPTSSSRIIGFATQG